MYGKYSESPMCNWLEEDICSEDSFETEERGLTLEKHKVTHYADGSTTHHWGGPCGSTNYNQFGEEC